MQRSIVIYHDEGVGEVGLSCLQTFFAKDNVRLVNALSVIDNSAFESCDIFVMPGGADLPYCKRLNGAGNRNIRIFIENGGTYLGICAGAYYACTSIEYHKGRQDEICQQRELALIDAIGIGSLPDLAPWYDTTLNSAAIATLWDNNDNSSQVFYHGGCSFYLINESTVEILARYATIAKNPPAIIGANLKKGRVILSGVHFEITPALLAQYPIETIEEKLTLQSFLTDFTRPYDGNAILPA